MKTVYNGHENKGGIYQIRNIQNGKVYIGSTICFKRRYSQHESKLKKGTHFNKHLLSAWNKYGSAQFLFEVLEVNEGSREEIRKQEQVIIDSYSDKWERCYNLDKRTKHCQQTWSKNPETTSRKKSANAKKLWADPDFRERMSGENHPSYGKSRTEQVKKKISKANKGNTAFKGKSHSKKTKVIMSKMAKARGVSEKTRIAQKKALTGRKQTIAHIQKRVKARENYIVKQSTKKKIGIANSKRYDCTLVDPLGNHYSSIQNLSEFCRIHNLRSSKIHLVIQRKRNHHKGWTLLAN